MSHVPTAAVRWRAEVANVLRQPGPRPDGRRRGSSIRACAGGRCCGCASACPSSRASPRSWPPRPDRYLVVFAVLASGAYTTPALCSSPTSPPGGRRGPTTWCWWLWLVAVVLMYGIGCAMVLRRGHGRTPCRRAVSAVAVTITGLLVMTVVVWAVRTRSGRRAVTVDLVESVMSVIVVAAASGIVWGDDVRAADADWYAVPASLAAVAMVFGVYWAVLLFVRLRGERSAPGSGGGDRARRGAAGGRGAGERRGADGAGDHRVRAAQRPAARAPRAVHEPAHAGAPLRARHDRSRASTGCRRRTRCAAHGCRPS